MNKTKTFQRRCRGTAMVLIIIISVVMTGLVMTIAWSAGLQSQAARGSLSLDQATMAAESAGQVAVWQFKHNNGWLQAKAPTPLPTVTVGSNTFTYATTCTEAGAVATLYWPFKEGSGQTTADMSSNNNTGTLIGGVTWVPGRFGNALQFDGATGYVDAGNDPSVNITGSMSMSAWVKMNSAAQDQKVGGNQDNITGGYKMAIFGQKVEFELHNMANHSATNRNVAGGTILTTGVWYHLAGVYNIGAGTICTYVNGILDRQIGGCAPDALASTAGHFQMGREPWVVGGKNRYFNGTMDDVRLYNRALSAKEVQTLANSSVHIHTIVAQKNPTATPASAVVDFVCSAPAPLPPIAPALTVGGALSMDNLDVSGDVQGDAAVTINGTTTVNGALTYGTTFKDSGNNLTLTSQGKTGTPVHQAGSVPTIDYAAIKALAVATFTGGSNQHFGFNHVNNGVDVFVVNGDCTDPKIDTSTTGGTILFTGNLTITKNATWGSDGLPAYVIVQGHVTQTARLTLNGALYVGGNWVHDDANITGDICIGGSVTDNSSTGSTFISSSIPWFDPRSSAPVIPQNIFYAAYQGSTP